MTGAPGAGGDGEGIDADRRRLDDDITRRFSDAARQLASGGQRRTGEPAPPARPLSAPPVPTPVPAAGPPGGPSPAPPPGDGPEGAHPAQPGPTPGHRSPAPQVDRTTDATQRLPRVDEHADPTTRSPRHGVPPGTPQVAGAPAPAAPRSRRGAAGTTEGAPTGAEGVSGGVRGGAGAPRGPRRARLVVRRVDPWSVFKLAFVYSSCLLVVLVVAVATLRAVLEAMGVFDAVTSTVQEVVDTGGALDRAFSTSTVVSITAVVGAVNVVIVTALATLGAVLYNLCSDLVGGVEVTLADRD